MQRKTLIFLSAVLTVACCFDASFGQRTSVRTQGGSRTRTTRPSEATEDVSEQNPFAMRAGRGAASSVPGAAATPVPAETPSLAPRGDRATPANADLLVLRDGTANECTLERLSFATGAIFSGREEVVPFTRIERIDVAVSDAFLQALDAFESGRRAALDAEYRRALALFKEARSTTTRRLEKEWATAKIVETLLALGRGDDAVVEFFILCRLEPYTAFLPSAPLRWLNRRSLHADPNAARAAETAAAEWLDARENPTGAPCPFGRLLAASTLLRSPAHGEKARAALRDLSVLEAPDDAAPEMGEACRIVALLAMEQLWREDVLRAPNSRVVENWSRTILATPLAYRCGPLATLATAEKALQRDEEAARDFMVAGTLALDRELRSFALTESAAAFERLGESQSAQEMRRAATKLGGAESERR